MSSSSKLDYLSKYRSSNDENENDAADTTKKRKKSKKRKKHSKADRVTVQDYDENEDDGAGAGDAFGADNQDVEDTEDAPVVVPVSQGMLQPETAASSSRGFEAVSGSKSQRRRRYDSDDDDESEKGKSTSTDKKRRTRHDSEDDNESVEAASRPRRRTRHDSSDEEKPNTKREQASSKRRRYDSSDDEEKPRRARNDSEKDKATARRERHDSSEEDKGAGKRRKRHDSSEEDDNKEKMSSGHSAGLQTGQTFSVSEGKIQAKKKQAAQVMVDKYGMGDTVYRDESGKQTDAPKDKNSRRKLTNQEQVALNTGRVQREKLQSKQQEWADLQQSAFARHADDVGLEDDRKNVLREGDPMAAKAAKKQAAARGKQRPVYKGPAPKPNRFGIRPGFRWDGVDRANNFEDKILARKFNAQHRQEKAHRWSTADM